MTAPREDAGALVAELREYDAAMEKACAVLRGAGRPTLSTIVWQFFEKALALVEQGEEKAKAYRATLTDYDRRVGELQALVEQGERDRRRRRTLEAAVWWALGESDSEFRAGKPTEGPYYWRRELRLRAGFLPNDSAARTGQEG